MTAILTDAPPPPSCSIPPAAPGTGAGIGAEPGVQPRPLEVALLTRTRESCAAPRGCPVPSGTHGSGSETLPEESQRPRGVQGRGRRSCRSPFPAARCVPPSRSPPTFPTLHNHGLHASPRTSRPQPNQRSGRTLCCFQVSPYRPTPRPHPGTPRQSPAVRLRPAGSARLRSCPGFPPRCRFLIPQPCSDLLGNANPRGSACPEALGPHLSVCLGWGGDRQTRPRDGAGSRAPGELFWMRLTHSSTQLFTEAGPLETVLTQEQAPLCISSCRSNHRRGFWEASPAMQGLQDT